MTDLYDIVRFRFEGDRSIIKRGLTLDEAQAHCQDESTHGDGGPFAADGTPVDNEPGPWFDGYGDAGSYDCTLELGAREAIRRGYKILADTSRTIMDNMRTESNSSTAWAQAQIQAVLPLMEALTGCTSLGLQEAAIKRVEREDAEASKG